MSITLHKLADNVGQSRPLLRKRLNRAKSVLSPEFKRMFRQSHFDFTNKRLYSGNRLFYLQWVNNGETSEGDVFMFANEQ